MKTFVLQMLTAFFVVAVFLLSSCHSTKTPENLPIWSEIEQYIRQNWLTYVDTTDNLPYPFSYALNPGTLYYWDLYFINEGLMMQGFNEQARYNIDNFIYEIEQLGFIPNAHGWGEDRSQTPYFALMVRSYYDKTGIRDTAWIRRAYTAILKEYEFWCNIDNTIEDHTTPVKGLQRYSHHADDSALLKFYNQVLHGRFQTGQEIPGAEQIRLQLRPLSDVEKIEMAGHRLAEAETMDFNPRFNGRCQDFIPVDLNSNLYAYEKNLAYFGKLLGISGYEQWDQKADDRARLIDQWLWNEERGLYLDYDFKRNRHSDVASVMTVMPLYHGFASPDKADRVREALTLFERPGGLVVCDTNPYPIHYQWGDATVWAPVQFLAMQAMKNYGFDQDAEKIALTFLHTVTENYKDPQPVNYPPFKYGDGTRRPGYLYEKYTDEGLIDDREYPCSHMMGWTAATFLKALDVTGEALK